MDAELYYVTPIFAPRGWHCSQSSRVRCIAEFLTLFGPRSLQHFCCDDYSVFSENDIPVISGMPLHRQLDIDQFHFKACPVNLKQFSAYLAASIELTMQIATLHDAMHCLKAPTAYANKTKKAGGNSTAEDLWNQTETILPSHHEETKNFMQERDTKIRISKVIVDPWFHAREADGRLDPNEALATICDAAGLPRKLKVEDMLIT